MKDVGLSAVRLSERTKQLGHPIHRVALGKIMTAERCPTVDELVVIAMALGTSPVMLLFGDRLVDGKVELMPGVPVPANSAMRWFAGQEPISSARGHYEEKNTPVQLVEELATVQGLLDAAQASLAKSPDGGKASGMMKQAHGLMDWRERILTEMRRQGMVVDDEQRARRDRLRDAEQRFGFDPAGDWGGHVLDVAPDDDGDD